MLPPYRTVPTADPAVSGLLVGGSSVLGGWSWVETTGSAAAELQLFDGNDTGGALITDITLSSGQSTRDLIGAHGLGVRNSLYLNVVSGSVFGAVWVVTVEQIGAFAVTQGVAPVWSGGE